MFKSKEELLARFPSLRRYFNNGFRYVPERDAPKFGFVCLESANQCLFVDPETGYFRAGRTIRL